LWREWCLGGLWLGTADGEFDEPRLASRERMRTRVTDGVGIADKVHRSFDYGRLAPHSAQDDKNLRMRGRPGRETGLRSGGFGHEFDGAGDVGFQVAAVDYGI
jgi:hypothetical protein